MSRFVLWQNKISRCVLRQIAVSRCVGEVGRRKKLLSGGACSNIQASTWNTIEKDQPEGEATEVTEIFRPTNGFENIIRAYLYRTVGDKRIFFLLPNHIYQLH
jgi:hypothetical protein